MIFLIVPVVVLLSPWLLFELRHNFFITNQVLIYLRSGEVSFSASNYFERVLDLIWFSFDRLIGQGNQAVTAGAIILSMAGIVSTILSGKDGPLRERTVLIMFTFYFWLNIFGIALYRFPLSNHYVSALYPVIILFFSVGIFQMIFNLPIFYPAKQRAFWYFYNIYIVYNLYLPHNNLNSNHGYTMPGMG